MDYAKILVPMTGSPSDGIALGTAFTVAKSFDAHVAALFVHPDPREPTPYVYSQMRTSPLIIQSVIDSQAKLAAEMAAAARSTFKACVKDFCATEVSSPTRSDGISGSFAERYGFVPQLVHEAARFSDLVVFKPVVADERPEYATAVADTLTKANRPILLSAEKPIPDLARHIAIAWDGRDSAAHAVTAALPFLKRASKVDLLTIQLEDGRPVSGTDAIVEYLSLHGVKVASRCLTHDRRSLGAHLMDAAAEAGADLIVMGGYGHSRLRETVLGGVTLDVVSHHSLPVFLMH